MTLLGNLSLPPVHTRRAHTTRVCCYFAGGSQARGGHLRPPRFRMPWHQRGGRERRGPSRKTPFFFPRRLLLLLRLLLLPCEKSYFEYVTFRHLLPPSPSFLESRSIVRSRKRTCEGERYSPFATGAITRMRHYGKNSLPTGEKEEGNT